MSDSSEKFSEDRKARRRRLTERLEALRERTGLIELELKNYTNDFFRVCIFGSARIKPDDAIYQTTEALATALGKEGIDVLTGGGPGLMEAANKGVLSGKRISGSKSKSYGITIELNQFEQPSDHLDIKHHHKKFSSRLDDFMRLSNAIIIVQGGIGTLLELYFSWQLLQVGHMPERPIILFDKPFWEGLIEWMKATQIKRGLVSPGDLRWIHLVDTAEEAMEIIRVEHLKFKERQVAQGRS
ncbi:MAG: LOG family protein [Bdellovibrionota bacterium]